MMETILFFTALVFVLTLFTVPLRIIALLGRNHISDAIRYGFWGLSIFFTKPLSILYPNMIKPYIGTVHLNFVFILIGFSMMLMTLNIGLHLIFVAEDAKKQFKKFLYPPVILTLLYLIWCSSFGEPYNHHYKNFEEILNNLGTAPILYRIAMITIEVYYLYLALKTVLKLKRYGIGWLYKVTICFVVASTIHIAVTCHFNALTGSIYYTTHSIIILICELLLIQKNSLKTPPIIQSIGIKRNNKTGKWEFPSA